MTSAKEIKNLNKKFQQRKQMNHTKNQKIGWNVIMIMNVKVIVAKLTCNKFNKETYLNFAIQNYYVIKIRNKNKKLNQKLQLKWIQ